MTEVIVTPERVQELIEQHEQAIKSLESCLTQFSSLEISRETSERLDAMLGGDSSKRTRHNIDIKFRSINRIYGRYFNEWHVNQNVWG